MTTKDDRQDGPIESRMHLYIMHTRGEEKKGKVFDGGNRGSKNIRAHVEISRDLFRDRDWIRSPEGWWYRGENLLSSPPPSPLFSIYGALWEIRGPLFRPLSVNNPPMMHLSSNFRWKFHRNFYPISSTRPYPLLRLPPRIHLCIRADTVVVVQVSTRCHRSFVHGGLTRRDAKGRERGFHINLLLVPLGIRNE